MQLAMALSAILQATGLTPPDAHIGLQNKSFARFQKKAGIGDKDLWEAAQSVQKGVIDADRGGGVIKQRIARAGEGRSGGSRSILLFRSGRRAIYVYGFEKKKRANIKADELEAFRKLAKVVLGYTDTELTRLVEEGALYEIRAQEAKGYAEQIS